MPSLILRVNSSRCEFNPQGEFEAKRAERAALAEVNLPIRLPEARRPGETPSRA